MTAQELWNEYTAANPDLAGERYEAWSYGSDDPDALLALTLSGRKTATASAYPVYLYERSPLPAVGDHSVILSAAGDARCIIRTSSVAVTPFCEVGAEHARKEGEGDLSLDFWRKAHEYFFTRELSEISQQFTEDMPVVCEEFEVVWPK